MTSWRWSLPNCRGWTAPRGGRRKAVRVGVKDGQKFMSGGLRVGRLVLNEDIGNGILIWVVVDDSSTF